MSSLEKFRVIELKFGVQINLYLVVFVKNFYESRSRPLRFRRIFFVSHAFFFIFLSIFGQGPFTFREHYT